MLQTLIYLTPVRSIPPAPMLDSGWLSMRLNKDPPEDLRVVEYVGIVDTQRLAITSSMSSSTSASNRRAIESLGYAGAGGILGATGELEGLPPLISDEGNLNNSLELDLVSNSRCNSIFYCSIQCTIFQRGISAMLVGVSSLAPPLFTLSCRYLFGCRFDLYVHVLASQLRAILTLVLIHDSKIGV